jgi:hypothetical protein
VRRQLITRALAGTASRLESGFGLEVTKRENRLRFALADALANEAVVAEVRISPEWRPEMPYWPSGGAGKRLGGFDVALRYSDDRSYSLVAELKWTHYGFVNALDEAIWDAFKLAHASATLEGVRDGLLIYMAPVKAWNRPARFANFFTDSFSDSRKLIAEHEGIWRWCLAEGSRARPTKLPPALETGPVACAPLLHDGEAWEIRAGVVRANGEPWLDLDPDGMPVPETKDTKPVFIWPYPDPGPGMAVADGQRDFEWPTYASRSGQPNAWRPRTFQVHPRRGVRSRGLPRIWMVTGSSGRRDWERWRTHRLTSGGKTNESMTPSISPNSAAASSSNIAAITILDMRRRLPKRLTYEH